MDANLTKALETLKGVSTNTLTTQLLKRGLASTFIGGTRPLNPAAGRLVGPAYTLRLLPMREDKLTPEKGRAPEYPQRRAVSECPAGHVLVIDARGDTGTAVLGDILMSGLKSAGAAGVVTDGAMRDTEAMIALDFPIFCGGIAAKNSHISHLATELQVPVACGDAAVFPGDIIVADADGGVVFPVELAEELAEQGAEQEQLEEFLQQRVAGGAPVTGTYPPNDETRAAYEAWKRDR